MKKLLIVAALLLPVAAWCATQAQNLGVVSISVRSMTAAQVAASTSTAKGELVFCSNCGSAGAAGTLCVSTATAVASFVLSTGTACK